MATVLIIDDEEGIRTSLQDILEDEGYKVILAENGAKGLSAAREEIIDVALVDIWLPNVNGIDVVRKLKKINPATESVIITGHGNVSNAIAAMQAGAYDFLEKPLSIDKVLFSIKKALEHKFLLNDINIIKQNILNYYKLPDIDEYSEIKNIADDFLNNNDNILITGKQGTGKKSLLFYLFARAVENNKSSVMLYEQPELYNYRDKYIFIQNSGMDYKYFEDINNKYNNRLIVSYNGILGDEISGVIKDYFKVIELPAVTESRNILEYFFNYFLNVLSTNLNVTLKKVSSNEVDILYKHTWKYNILEVKNLIEFFYIHREEYGDDITRYIKLV